MEQNSIKEIILKTMNSINPNLKIKFPSIIESFKKELNNNFKILIEANKIDIKNNNGFEISLNIINNICDTVLKENYSYGDVIISKRDEEKKLVYGKEISNTGLVCTIFDGNPYTLIELLLKNILVNNSSIYIYNNYMLGTNTYIIEILKSILEKNNLDNNMVNQYITSNYEEVLNHYTSIDLVLCIGPKELQNNIISISKNKTILSGYTYSEIYIDSLEHQSFIQNIITENKNITIYAKESLNIETDNFISVLDEDEAISLINLNGSGFASSIFTNNNEIASKFLNEVKSNQVTVNTSPTIEQVLDIKLNDLYKEKTIIYPISNILDGTRTEIKIKE